MLITGRILIILAVLMMFGAYFNFAPTALSSDQIADYVKNHFVREMIFGSTLSIIVIRKVCNPINMVQVKKIVILGSAVILPFWIAVALGWSTEGIDRIWRGEISSTAAFALHIPQTLIFIVGVSLLCLSQRNAN